MTAILDGDVILYRCINAATEGLVFKDEIIIRADLEVARELVDVMVPEMVEAAGRSRALLCLSATGPPYRRRIWPGYKANRGPKPYGFKHLRDYMLSTYKTMVWGELEADDVMGILSTSPARVLDKLKVHRTPRTARPVVVSIDKDMRTFPGLLVKDEHGEVETITEDEAKRAFYAQVLTGDRVDGYPGCPKIGPVTAKKALESCHEEEDFWFAVVREYEKKGLTEDDALVQARCARILRHGEYDIMEEEIKLWQPPQL